MGRYKGIWPGHGLQGQSKDSKSGVEYTPTYTQIEEAIVVDVLTGERDEKDDSVGMIRFKKIYEKSNLYDSSKYSARPLNTNIKSYPLIGETVYILTLPIESDKGTITNVHYYFNSINIPGTVINNSWVPRKSYISTDGAVNPDDDSEIPNSEGDSDNEYKPGEYFKINNLIPPMMGHEGDVILQGRFGNSIRLGSNYIDETNTPSIKINNRAEYEYEKPIAVDENLDEYDCIWMTTDETLEFEIHSIPITGDEDTKIKSTTEDDWTGRQISIFSDRIILQSKANEIIGYSNLGIHWSCNTNFSIDSDNKIITNTANNTELNTKKEVIITSDLETRIKSLQTMIGSLDADEPLVCGNLWKDMMMELLDILIEHNHPSSTGPTGPPIQAGKFQKVKTSISNDEQLSDDNFTTKTNG